MTFICLFFLILFWWGNSLTSCSAAANCLKALQWVALCTPSGLPLGSVFKQSDVPGLSAVNPFMLSSAPVQRSKVAGTLQSDALIGRCTSVTFSGSVSETLWQVEISDGDQKPV